MDFFESARILARRWKIWVPGLLLIVLSGTAIALAIGPQYQVVGSVVLVAPVPTGAGSTVDANPYLLFSGSLNVTASMLGRIMTTDSASVERMRRAGATAQYEITASTSSSPILAVTATGASPGEATQTVAALSQGIQDELIRVQQASGASPETWIKAEVLTPPDQATLVLTRPLRAVALAVALGTAGVVILAFFVEGLERKRLAPTTRRAGIGSRKRVGAEASI